jgi:hypothetical protein
MKWYRRFQRKQWRKNMASFMMKYFIITIDAEGDNLWDYRLGDAITTRNSRYLPRFQELCAAYGYKPVYLVNYEMAQDDFFTLFALNGLAKNACEIGIHPHPWNNPPTYELPNPYSDYGLPYLIEYPEPVMRKKFDFLYKVLKNKLQTEIVAHRAGRWATNQEYFDILIDYGIKIDCSVTPHVSWKRSKGFSGGSKGSDYSASPEAPYYVQRSHEAKTLLEIPVTIRKPWHFSAIPWTAPKPFHPRSFLSGVKKAVFDAPVWLRPNGHNLPEMFALMEYMQKSDSDYLMFMLHSSELMPSGSPRFRTDESIERLYDDLKTIFDKIAGHYTGTTLKEYFTYRSSL